MSATVPTLRSWTAARACARRAAPRGALAAQLPRCALRPGVACPSQRRSVSALSADTQQRVRPAFSDWGWWTREHTSLISAQMLGAPLQQADPIMYDVIEKVGAAHGRRGVAAGRSREKRERMIRGTSLTMLAGTGETQAKAVHQPDPVRELHVAGCSRRSRESYAKCVPEDH